MTKEFDLTTIVKTTNKVQTILYKNQKEWEKRYAEYADKILANEKILKKQRAFFNKAKNLDFYMPIGKAGGNKNISVRYLGQDVAKIKINKNNEVLLSTKEFAKNNKKNFDYSEEFNSCNWSTSQEAKNFRKYFAASPRRINKGKKNEEHRIENLFLRTLSVKNSKTKPLELQDKQPVQIFDMYKFQMPTVIKASGKGMSYAQKGGGIDILARVRMPNNTINLCVMEIKDENTSREPADNALAQAIAYATFIRELLRSRSGQKWYKIFGYKRKVPENLQILVCCVMPDNSKLNKTNFPKGIYLGENKDYLSFHYLYFRENGNKLTKIKTSLP